MAHQSQINYCLGVKHKFPQYFKNARVLDIGSMDVNGSNRYLFANSKYIGIDIGKGKNVDYVGAVHRFKTNNLFTTIICTEMLEHDKFYEESFKAMINLLKPSGLLIITAAYLGRAQHGTYNHFPESSSHHTHNFYQNVSAFTLLKHLDPDENFHEFEINVIRKPLHDIRFYGIKKA